MNGIRKSKLDKDCQVKYGILLSYLLIILNALYGLFATPYILRSIGDSEYGVYKTLTALTSSIMVLDLGLGGTVMRYTAKYRAENDEKSISNFVAMSIIQALLVCACVGIVCVFAYRSLDKLYGKTFTADEMTRAKQLFIVLTISIMVHVIENVFNGVVTGYNHFLFGNGIKVARLTLRIALIYVLLIIIPNSMTITIIDLFLSVTLLFGEIWYAIRKLGVEIKLGKWNNYLFIESGKYSVLMFLTSIAVQTNNNLDNVFIGALCGTESVTVYSFGLVLFGMFEQLSTSISGVMLPTVSNFLVESDGMLKARKLIVRVGRIQFMLLGAAFVGFIVLGRDFLNIWLGEGFEDVYLITVTLMGPALFELCVNVCLTILRAKNMLTFRTIVLLISTVLNAILTYFAITQWSYVGAAFGTAVSFIIGSLLIMNVYYQRKLGLNIIGIYSSIFSRTWVCLVVAGVSLYLFHSFLYGNMVTLVACVAIFIAIYCICLWCYGFNCDEKLYFKQGGKKDD